MWMAGIRIVSAGRQPSSGRHGANFDGAPPIANWRANLTGLSQTNNLYFIAYRKDIYVYQPQFPSQKINRNPDLIITSQPSASRLSGYIDRRHPHNINNLVISFLGTEEVIAVVRDDGDVDAFLVRHIVQAIERRAENTSAFGLHATEVRPFFQNNVGISAWGLAIHAEARIIAVSSNAHEVRIFKFGLAQNGGQDDPSSSQEASEDAEHEEGSDRADERHSDVTHHIINGESNIPYIAFCHTGDDPEGRWLLTTDIGGVCRVMDLRELKTVQVFQFGRLPRDLAWTGFDRINAGWVLMFLDRRSFQTTDDVYAALGLDEQEIPSYMRRNPSVWDLSQTVQRLPGHKQPFIYRRKREDRRPLSRFASPQFGTANTSTLEADTSDDSMDNDSNDGAPLYIEDDPSQLEASTATTSRNTSEVSSIASNTSDHASINIIDDAEDLDDEMTEDTISFNDWYNGDTISNNIPHYLSDDPLCENLPCPILHASCRNIYLIQPSDPLINPGPDVPPLIGLANPLRQRIQQDFDYLSQQQRLNMAVCIPPIGIVIVASQKGRAMVLSLSKLPASTVYPPEMLPKKHNNSNSSDAYVPPWLDKTTYAMRLECILPFAEQEELNQRPFLPLHGIAASPLQGCGVDEVKGTAMRWRLMMMYQDHSILSYEISRSKGEGDGVKAKVKGLGTTLESVIV